MEKSYYDDDHEYERAIRRTQREIDSSGRSDQYTYEGNGYWSNNRGGSDKWADHDGHVHETM